ncbi:HNH endonuclease [Thalassospira xiamenensis]|uniref:HNH endonuclease n=1 Tax=Thalassospira xiamenensis TaxID=220697 RepID=UPI003B969F07|nr:HNH endonuclease [Thalassospira xiamenensis]
MTNNSQNSERPPVPAELKRRVLVEAGHRCAIPTCRYIKTEIHHIVPWATCQKHEYKNLIALCPNCHDRADANEIDRKALRTYKANLRFMHDKFSQLEIDILFELNALPVGGGRHWPPFMHLLLKRIVDEEYIQIHSPPNAMYISGMKASPDTIIITHIGREFIKELGTEEL